MVQIFHEQHGGEAPRSVNHAIIRHAKQVVILPIRLNAERLGRSRVKGKGKSSNATHPEETRAQETLAKNGITIPPLNPSIVWMYTLCLPIRTNSGGGPTYWNFTHHCGTSCIISVPLGEPQSLIFASHMRE
jgi:hypothetical protein